MFLPLTKYSGRNLWGNFGCKKATYKPVRIRKYCKDINYPLQKRKHSYAAYQKSLKHSTMSASSLQFWKGPLKFINIYVKSTQTYPKNRTAHYPAII